MSPKLGIALIALLAGFLKPSANSYAQLIDPKLEANGSAPQDFTLAQFISLVAASNIDLAAQRFNVSIAEAQLVAARISPNPNLSFGVTRDVSHKEQPNSENIGLSQTLELPFKRHFRISVATKNLLAASSTLEDFFRTLRGTAAGAFIDAVAANMIVQQKRKAFESLNRLADLNRIRFQQGDIAEVDYNQALVDSLQAQGDLTTVEVTWRTAQLALIQLLGTAGASLPRPRSALKVSDRNFDLAVLLESAMQTRPDIVAARNTYASTLASVGLARSNRLPDVTASVLLQQNESGRNPINPSPNFDSLNFGVSFPLPIFNSYRGEYLAAQRTALQSEKTLRSVELKAAIDVRQNFERYRLAKQRAWQYEGPVLDLAGKVLDARLAAYKAGGATLLDVLTAQKADSDVRLASIDALSERAKALVGLEQAANFWDIDF